MRRTWIVSVLLIAALSFAAGRAFSQDKGGKEGEKKEGKGEQPKMTPEEEAWMKLAQPGEEHKRLQRMVGEWDFAAKMWMKPDQPAQESKGKASCRSVLGGRFVVEEYDATTGDEPFQGLGVFGYDNQKKKYTSAWMDSMGTGIMLSEGTGDAEGNTTLIGTYQDPEGKTWTWRSVTTIKGDQMTYDGYNAGPDGKEHKGMEIRYTKKK